VVTIHDVVAFTRTETVPRKYALYMRLLLKQVVQKVDKIIAPSISTKNDLIECLNTPEEKIDVVYNAVSPHYAPASPDCDHEEIKRKFGIRNKYIFFAGNLEPRKNLIRLMEAFNMSRSKLGEDYQLVICGKKGWLYKDILQTYEKLKMDDDIILTNYVTEEDLLSLYQCADIFAFPTLYEGFGFPPLEAMGCGVPVIASNVSSLPEIVGDAALLVDPLDTAQISEAIVTMANSESLRKQLIEKGLKQSAKFSWEDTARKTLDVYASVF
jgi:glycosyltransferase involved in cell wall biosynthesis